MNFGGSGRRRALGGGSSRMGGGLGIRRSRLLSPPARLLPPRNAQAVEPRAAFDRSMRVKSGGQRSPLRVLTIFSQAPIFDPKQRQLGFLPSWSRTEAWFPGGGKPTNASPPPRFKPARRTSPTIELDIGPPGRRPFVPRRPRPQGCTPGLGKGFFSEKLSRPISCTTPLDPRRSRVPWGQTVSVQHAKLKETVAGRRRGPTRSKCMWAAGAAPGIPPPFGGSARFWGCKIEPMGVRRACKGDPTRSAPWPVRVQPVGPGSRGAPAEAQSDGARPTGPSDSLL